MAGGGGGGLRCDFFYNTTLPDKFWFCRMRGYLPSLQGRTKKRVTRNNICTGQLVLVGDTEDISKRGAYRLGRVHWMYPQWRKGKKLVRRATVAVLKDCRDGTNIIEYILRDISQIAPV